MSKIIIVCLSLTVFLTISVMVGWWLGVSPFGTTVVEMNPTSAFCFMLSCLALWAQHSGRPAALTQKMAIFSSLFISFLATLKLVSFVGYDARVDWFYFTTQQNRMAPNTAVCLLLVGFSIFSLTRGWALVKEI
jgi:hypothetical protein